MSTTQTRTSNTQGSRLSKEDARRMMFGAEIAAKAKNQVQKREPTLKDAMRKLKKMDEVTYNHSVRCGNYLAILAKEMGKTPQEVQTYRQAGYAHDLGKMKVMDAVKSKVNFRENPEEGERIKAELRDHVKYGDSILSKISDNKQEYIDAARYHHCHYKPSDEAYSYETQHDPDGVSLTGDDIPEVAQMLTVVDVYDALIDNSRSYRQEPFTEEKVMSIMKENMEEGQFNEKYYKVFMEKVIPQIKQMGEEEKKHLSIRSKEQEQARAMFDGQRFGQQESFGQHQQENIRQNLTFAMA